jgi:hypothetical protein
MGGSPLSRLATRSAPKDSRFYGALLSEICFSTKKTPIVISMFVRMITMNVVSTKSSHPLTLAETGRAASTAEASPRQ